MSRVTIRDVAEAAGVSISAVSYILNGSTKKKYADATVKAVKRAAERLGYSPNQLARGMRSQKANAIGIVNFWENNSAVFAPTLCAVAEAAKGLGCVSVVCTGCEDFSYIAGYKNRTVDGFVVIAPSSLRFNERAHIRALQEAGAPFAIVNAGLRLTDVASVFYNYYEVSALAVKHLFEKGLQRIVYVDEFIEEAARELRDRREGYEDTMREVGLLPRTYDLEHLHSDDLDGIEAVVTPRAETARALMRRLLDDGIRVPGDFQLIAGSKEENGREGYVALTAAEFSYRSAAEYAVRAVLGLEPPKAFVPSPSIVDGKTTH